MVHQVSRLSIAIPKELHDRVRVASAVHGVSVSSYIRNVLNKALDEENITVQRNRG